MNVGQEYSPYMMFVGSFIPNWLMSRTELTAVDKLVFARLSQYAGKNEKCYPSQEQIAKSIGASHSAVRLSIKHLIELRLIKVTKPTGVDILRHMRDSYTFLWSEMCECFENTEELDESEDENPIPPSVKKRHSGVSEKNTRYIRESLKENHIKSKTPPKTEEVKNPTSSERDFLKTNQSDFSLFRSAKNQVPSAHDHTKRLIHEFCKIYHKIMGVEHHNLTNDTYKTVTKRIEDQLYLLTDSFEARIEYMFDRFFEMKFRRPADYSLFLFSTCIEQLAERARREIQ